MRIAAEAEISSQRVDRQKHNIKIARNAALECRANVRSHRVGKCERGERRIDVLELQAFCRVLGIELQAFMVELQERQQRR